MKVCQATGVRLITIFEDEWNNRGDQVKSFLTSVLNKNTRKLHARKCKVRLITPDQGKQFIKCWHIQGMSQHGLHFASLFDEEELVGVMSFGRHPRKATTLVLDRLCYKQGVSIAGGASRLFKFLTNATKVPSLTSWSDNRWSEGRVYATLGFVKDTELPPDYSYVNFKTGFRHSKQSQKKDTVNCPAEMTELEFARSRNMHRIWDCGKIRWSWQAS